MIGFIGGCILWEAKRPTFMFELTCDLLSKSYMAYLAHVFDKRVGNIRL